MNCYGKATNRVIFVIHDKKAIQILGDEDSTQYPLLLAKKTLTYYGVTHRGIISWLSYIDFFAFSHRNYIKSKNVEEHSSLKVPHNTPENGKITTQSMEISSPLSRRLLSKINSTSDNNDTVGDSNRQSVPIIL